MHNKADNIEVEMDQNLLIGRSTNCYNRVSVTYGQIDNLNRQQQQKPFLTTGSMQKK